MTTSQITWMDFSESDRRKMVRVISMFKQRDTRDEMGLARIRDGFADLFFPGTTTIQTRAKYFLYIPWLFRTYEKKRMSASKVQERLKRDESRFWKPYKKLMIRKGSSAHGLAPACSVFHPPSIGTA